VRAMLDWSDRAKPQDGIIAPAKKRCCWEGDSNGTSANGGRIELGGPAEGKR